MNTNLYPISSWSDKKYNQIKHDNSVAIIMRTKNRPVLLARAFESVIQQTHHEWHLYLINDGGDPKPINELIELNSIDLENKITFINNSKSYGRETASNCGLKIATEEFLVIHDDDDAWHRDFLKETVTFLNQNKNSIAVATNYTVVNEEIQKNQAIQINTENWLYCYKHIDIFALLQFNVLPQICLIIRMEIAKEIGEFNEKMPILGNWDYMLRLFRAGEIKTINKNLAFHYHRINNTSERVTSNLFDNYYQEYRDSLVRQSLQENQGNYGILHTILSDSRIRHEQINQKIGLLEYQLAEILDNIWYLKRKSFPLKRFAARVRHLIKKIRP